MPRKGGSAAASDDAALHRATAALGEAADGLRERRAGHDPCRVLADVAVAIADGPVTSSDLQVLADQQGLPGPAGSVASTSTIWRARDRTWLARGELTGTELRGSRAAGWSIVQVVIDLDPTLVTAHSDQEGAKGNFKAASATARSGGRGCRLRVARPRSATKTRPPRLGIPCGTPASAPLQSRRLAVARSVRSAGGAGGALHC